VSAPGPLRTCGTCRHDGFTDDGRPMPSICRLVDGGEPRVRAWAEQWWSDLTESVRHGAPPCPGWEARHAPQPPLPLARTLAVEVPACLAVHPDTGEQCGLPEQPGHPWHLRQGDGACVVWRVADDGSCISWRGGR
jgi:hypothetical protein